MYQLVHLTIPLFCNFVSICIRRSGSRAITSQLGVDVKVIKCRYLVERAGKQLYSYKSLSAFGLKSALNDFNVQGYLPPIRSSLQAEHLVKDSVLGGEASVSEPPADEQRVCAARGDRK